jgi:hypothetical protein
MNLQRREAIVRVEGQAPLHIRSVDRVPAFRDAEYKRLMLDRYLEQVARRDPSAIPVAEVDREIAERASAAAAPQRTPEVDFEAPEPMPLYDAPLQYANEYLARQQGHSKQPPGRPPVGQLDDRHDRFRVVDGNDGDISKDA